MIRVEEIKEEVETLGFTGWDTIAKDGTGHKFDLDIEKVIPKILTNFANRHAMTLDKFKELVYEYEDEITWGINEVIYCAIDTLIENFSKKKKYWKIENAVWIAILQDGIFDVLRELYFEMIRWKRNERRG